MKFTSYQSNAQLGTPASQVSNIHYSNPGAMALAKAEGDMYNTIGKGMVTFADKVSSAKALEANNYYNQRMSEESNSLMNNHKEGEALNITELYDQKQKAVLEETQKKYGSYIKFGSGAQAFQEYTMRDNATRRGNMQRYQLGETEKYQNTVFANQVDTTMQEIRVGGFTDQAIEGGINRLGVLTRERYGGYGEDRVAAETKKYAAEIVTAALDDAVTSSNYERINQLVDKMGSYVSVGQYNAIMKVVGAKQKETFTYDIAKKAFNKYGGNNPAAAIAEIQSQGGFWIETNKGNCGANTQLNLNDYVTLNNDSISTDTLSKPFSSGLAAMARDFAEAHKGQVLNITCGTEGQHVEGSDHYVGNAADIASDSMDDNVAEREWVKANAAKYGLSVYDEYENDSPYKTGGHLHIYLNDEDAALGVSKEGGNQPGGKFIQLSPADTQKVISAYQHLVSQQEWIENRNKKAMTEQLVGQYAGSGMTAAEIFNDASQGITDMNTLAAIKTAASIAGVHASNGGSSKKLLDADMANVANDIKAGKVPSLDRLIESALEQGVTAQSELNKLRKAWDDYFDGKGYYDISKLAAPTINSIVAGLPSGEKAKAKHELEAYVYGYYQKYQREHNGENPDETDLRKALSEARVPKPLGTYYPSDGWMGKDLSVSPAQLAAAGFKGMYTKETDPYQRLGDNEYYLIRKDGSALYVTGEELDILLGNASGNE